MTAVQTPTMPDVASLTREFRSRFLSVVETFAMDKTSGNELRAAWRPYYDDVFQSFDRTVEQAWRNAAGSDGSVEPGSPYADLSLTAPLSVFPVSIGHNNLDRLVEVIAVELGDRTASELSVPERLIDLAHVVDALHQLMSSLGTRP
jgi:hypothetical protein